MFELHWMAQLGQEGLGQWNKSADRLVLTSCCHGSVCTASPLPDWADVTHWSGKLHQTYSCTPTL